MDLIDSIKAGDFGAIERGLFHEGALYRVNSIISMIKKDYSTPMLISRLKELKTDDIPLFGTTDSYTVADFANAALDIMGIEHYRGYRKTVEILIQAKMAF